jgi:multimeric flavodoxin WrbA
MTNETTRRGFLRTVGTGAAATAALSALGAEAGAAATAPVKILGISTSLRKGKTTAAAVQRALDAAKAVAPDRIEVELIDIAGSRIPVDTLVGLTLPPGERDDFPAIAEKLGAPQVAGIIVGTPVYFANMTSLCKAFLERLMVFRKKDFALAKKVGGVLAVGGGRNGGGELTIQSVQAALMAQEMIVVGDGRPTCHFGPVLWSQNDSIEKDEVGLKATDNLGRNVAEVVLRMTPPRP